MRTKNAKSIRKLSLLQKPIVRGTEQTEDGEENARRTAKDWRSLKPSFPRQNAHAKGLSLEYQRLSVAKRLLRVKSGETDACLKTIKSMLLRMATKVFHDFFESILFSRPTKDSSLI